jgi:hypothetical protein
MGQLQEKILRVKHLVAHKVIDAGQAGRKQRLRAVPAAFMLKEKRRSRTLLALMAFYVLCSMFVFMGCTTELKLPLPKGEEKIVLLGELTAGDTVMIRAGKSQSLGTSTEFPQLIQDLGISLKAANGPEISLYGEQDDLSYLLLTIPYRSPERVQANTQYLMVAKHSDLGEASVAIQVPPAFDGGMISRKFENYFGDSILNVELEISDAAAAGHQYVIEVLRQPVYIYSYFYVGSDQYSMEGNEALYDSLKLAGVEVFVSGDTTYSGQYSRMDFYTNDASSENEVGHATGRTLRRLFFRGTAFGGTMHRTNVLIPRYQIYGTGEHVEMIVYIKSVAPDYYEFLKSYDQYSPLLGLNSTSTENLKGNVKNGFGAVGGVYRRVVRMLY